MHVFSVECFHAVIILALNMFVPNLQSKWLPVCSDSLQWFPRRNIPLEIIVCVFLFWCCCFCFSLINIVITSVSYSRKDIKTLHGQSVVDETSSFCFLVSEFHGKLNVLEYGIYLQSTIFSQPFLDKFDQKESKLSV